MEIPRGGADPGHAAKLGQERGDWGMRVKRGRGGGGNPEEEEGKMVKKMVRK